MTNPIQNEEENNLENTEEVVEKPKPVTLPNIQLSRAQIFHNPNNFGKWRQANNVNNRQRPWRAAWRWR